MRIAVIGAGSWGTAVAALAGAHGEVRLWARRRELAEAIQRQRTNPDYLPSAALPDSVEATASLAEAVTDIDVMIMAVPSHGFRNVLEEASGHLASAAPVVSLTKGVEQDSLLRMTEVVTDVLGPDRVVGVLTGPNLAREIAAGQPAASVIAATDPSVAEALQDALMSPTFRVYTNDDVVGCEAAGALKNVMAIAAGMARGLGYGDNSLAALITRALAELTRLGIALGGRAMTFAGLAGMGDLVATCISEQSRNRTVGFELGRGRTLEEIIDHMQMVAEGVKSTGAILQLADRHGVEMPIARAVGSVLYEGRAPGDVVEALMTRRAKSETHGLD